MADILNTMAGLLPPPLVGTWGFLMASLVLYGSGNLPSNDTSKMGKLLAGSLVGGFLLQYFDVSFAMAVVGSAVCGYGALSYSTGSMQSLA